MDILIKNGQVVDGSGAAAYRADVLVSGDRIRKIQPEMPVPEEGVQVIDASGCYVTPGFIDMHAHSDYILGTDGTMNEKLRQGVTTSLMGSCGLSAAPVNRRAVNFYRRFTKGMFGTTCPFTWNTMGEYLEHIRGMGLGSNVVAQVGFGNLRLMTMGVRPGRPSKAQIEKMKSLLAQSLDEGAHGLSTGIVYPPQLFASQEEITEVCRVVPRREDHIYTTHVRDELDKLVPAVQEAIDTARAAGVSLQISHHKAVMRENWGKVDVTLDMMQKARDAGMDVEADVYPYTAFSNIFVPTLTKAWPGMENEIIFLQMDNPKNRDIEGKTVAQALEIRRTTLRRLTLSLIASEGIAALPIAGFTCCEEDVRKVLCAPFVSLGSDGTEVANSRQHPRLYSTFVRFVRHYLLDEKIMPLEEGVRKMTGMAATKLRLKQRGLLREGYFADVVVFDPQTLRDNSRYDDPVHFPTGYRAVMVNGKVAVRDDARTDAMSGEVL